MNLSSTAPTSIIPGLFRSGAFYTQRVAELRAEADQRPEADGWTEARALASIVGALLSELTNAADHLTGAEKAHAELADELTATRAQGSPWEARARELARATVDGRPVTAALLIDVLGDERAIASLDAALGEGRC